MLFEHFNILKFSGYLLYTVRNEIEVVRLAYAISNYMKTEYFIDFLSLINLEKHKFFTTNKVLIVVYLLKFKKIKDICLLNFLNNYENGKKFLNKFFK